MKIVSVILARGGSKGIPKKNIIELCGKPLIEYAINASLKSSVHETWVSTDCDEIKSVCDAYDVNILNRPHEMSQDDSQSELALLHFAENVDFDFDGEMQPDVALNPIYKDIYPFSKIVGNANILIMPALHSAAISTKLMKVFGGGKLIGPLLIGLGSPIEVAPLRASTSEILNLASIAAYSSDVIDYSN